MAMKKFINDPNALTDELLEGLAVANGESDKPAGKPFGGQPQAGQCGPRDP